MKYIEKNNDSEKYYTVNYDENRLKEILKELEKYRYSQIISCTIRGNIVRWPATMANIKKRVLSVFPQTQNYQGATIIPESITHHKEKHDNYVTYDFKYNKLPDLYNYIDIIVNEKNILFYSKLFEKKNEEDYGNFNMFYVGMNSDQLLLDGILDYPNSPELKDHGESDNSYDYEGLYNLYLETLKCFTFTLVAVKNYIENGEEFSGFQLRKK